MIIEWTLLALLWAAAGTATGALLSVLTGGSGMGLPLSLLAGSIGGVGGGAICLLLGIKFLAWFPGEIVAAVVGAMFSLALLAIITRGRFADRKVESK